MIQLYPSKEHTQRDLEVQRRLRRIFTETVKPKEDISERLEETYFVIGCVFKELVRQDFSENFVVQLVSTTSDIPKKRVEEILEKSRRIYERR